MGHSIKALALMLSTLAVPAVAADPPSRPLLELEEAVQRAIARAEPAIACILVSRSEAYRRYESTPPPVDAPGQLGRFKFDLRANNPRDEETRKLLALDLSRTEQVPESFGSGIVIDNTGLVLTCSHVVRNATKVYVRLPSGKGSYADIHASDPRSDLAVLRLLDPLPDLRAAQFSDGAKLRKGQFVVGLANPYASGFRDGSPVASWGMIGNIRRRSPGVTSETAPNMQSLSRFGTLIQTDVRLSLGCSGGALVNLDGEVVGITSATAALSGVEGPGGFAVPINANFRRIIEVLARGEEVEYGFLGVTLSPLAHNGGVQINSVLGNGPAARAGIREGDSIVSVNGERLRENDDLFRLVGGRVAGSDVEVEVVSPSGERRKAFVRLAKFFVPTPPLASNRPAARGGLRVDYTSVLAQHDFAPRSISDGVMIREIVPNSAADKLPLLQVDRIITRINNVAVNTPAEFYAQMDRVGAVADLTVISAEGQVDHVRLEVR